MVNIKQYITSTNGILRTISSVSFFLRHFARLLVDLRSPFLQPTNSPSLKARLLASSGLTNAQGDNAVPERAMTP